MTLIRPPVTPMASNMSHVVQLVLPLTQFGATLSRQLSWSDFVNLLTLSSLDKHERQPGEEAPIDLILFAESRTELPPKAELEQKLHAALLEARERLAQRGVVWGTWMRSCDHNGQQRPGVPRAGACWRGMHVCQGRRRNRSCAGVLCGSDKGYAAAGDSDGWGRGYRRLLVDHIQQASVAATSSAQWRQLLGGSK